MKQEDKRKITGWLRSGRDFTEGVALYQRLGCNMRLKREFAFGETPLMKEILAEQLMALAGISPEELGRVVHPDVKAVPATTYQRAPEPVKAMLRLRDTFPFLNSAGCPDSLKVMVADMLTSHEIYTKAHAALASLAPEEEACGECRKIVENYLQNRHIWETLEYYKTHGSLPEEAVEREPTPEEEISRLSDLDLASKYRSAVTNEGKHRKSLQAAQEKGEGVEKAESMAQYWSHRKRLLKEEIEARKKK